MSCFDSYLLGKAVATFPLPVVVGIGHERDDTVLDYVAHTSLKTPTAVAEFLINQMKMVEEEIEEEMAELKEIIENFIEKERRVLTVLVDQWTRRVGDLLLSSGKELSFVGRDYWYILKGFWEK